MANDEQASGFPEWGHWLDFAPSGDRTLHEFCGENKVAGAYCPRCEKPLLRLLSLATNDPELDWNSPKVPFVHLLYCWTCSIPYDLFSYRNNADGSVELLEVPERKQGVEFGLEGPYDGYTGSFPQRYVSLRRQTEKQQEALADRWLSGYEDVESEFSEIYEPRHQIGGYPFIYNPQTRMCPICSENMRLLASLCDNANGEESYQKDKMKTFTDNCGVQMFFMFCVNCSVVSAAHSCD